MEVVSQRISVREPTDIAEARRRTATLAAAAGLDEAEAGRAGIAVSELATNIVRHGGGGEILLEANGGLQMIALDRGPGIGDLSDALRDGFSTGGTRGEGLGAVRRQADVFQVYSRPARGTAVLARFHRRGAAPEAVNWGAVAFPYPGETVSGDGWALRRDEGALSIMVADGLGHGLLAHEAAKTALSAFEKHGGREPEVFLQHAHAALRPTRGAAVSLARISDGRVDYAGVGNISGVLVEDAQRKMITHNGTLGHTAKKFQSFTYPTGPHPLIVMHSDGLGSSFSFRDYPGLAACEPILIAAVLYRDFDRKRDDVTVVAVKP